MQNTFIYIFVLFSCHSCKSLELSRRNSQIQIIVRPIQQFSKCYDFHKITAISFFRISNYSKQYHTYTHQNYWQFHTNMIDPSCFTDFNLKKILYFLLLSVKFAKIDLRQYKCRRMNVVSVPSFLNMLFYSNLNFLVWEWITH